MSEKAGSSGGIRKFLSELGVGALLSLAALSAALYLSQKPSFLRIAAAVSDEVSRLGVHSRGPIVLVRIDRTFSKPDLERLLSAAIPALVDNYRAAALGVDIDFSGRGYNELAGKFSIWSEGHPDSAAKVVWAIGYERGNGTAPGSTEIEACLQCTDASCGNGRRFRPRHVFDNQLDPANVGLAYAWTDSSGVSRSSFRFGCHQDTQAELTTFHSDLVEVYCSDKSHYDDDCAKLRPHHQSTTTLFSWYDAKSYDLCTLVQCSGRNLGQAVASPPIDLSGKILILYSDIEGDDEHATIFGTRKGAEIVASLAINELVYGESNHTLLEIVKWSIEIVLALVLIVLFHWPPTEHWAVLVSGLLFAGYLFLAPRISNWIPDFRNYVLAVMLGFAFEVWLKTVYQGFEEAIAKSRPSISPKAPGNETSAAAGANARVASPPTDAHRSL